MYMCFVGVNKYKQLSSVGQDLKKQWYKRALDHIRV